MRERGIDYFENSRRATLCAARLRDRQPDAAGAATATTSGASPRATARPTRCRSIERRGARASSRTRRAAPAAPHVLDDGTIAPTAAVVVASPFAPEIVIPAIARDARALRRATSISSTASSTRSTPASRYRRAAAARPASIAGVGWVDSDYLGIDQGPIVAMIENYRSELVWKRHAQQSAHRARPAARRVHAADGSTAAAAQQPARRRRCDRAAACSRWPRSLRLARGCARRATTRPSLEFWAMGREGEVVARAAAASSSASIPASASTSSSCRGPPRTRSC